MAPLEYTSDTESVLAVVIAAITDAGGSITSRDVDGVDAVFVTSVLRFKDDVSFRIDSDAKLIHFRSASRVGHSDLGANRKRMNELAAAIGRTLP